MSTTLKVLNAKKEVASHKITKGEPLVIKAKDKVNYQLIDDETGYGPQNIIAKRDGKDLVITLEDGDLNPDIIIKDYYGDNTGETSNLIVGLHENGNIYPYIPESGQTVDAVSMLAEQVAAPQALGGKELGAALWAFNPWWLAAAVPVAAAALLAGGSKKGGSKGGKTAGPVKPALTAKEDGSVDVTVPENAKPGDKVSVGVVLPNGETTTTILTKQPDGSWTSDNESIVPSIPVGQNTATIPAGKVKDGSKVTAKSSTPNGESDGTSVIAKVGGDPDVPPENPDLVEKPNGDIGVVPPTKNTETGDNFTVQVTPPNSTKPVDVVFTKKPDGGWTSSDEGTIPSIPPGGSTTIPKDKIKDGTPVKAKSHDKGNPLTDGRPFKEITPKGPQDENPQEPPEQPQPEQPQPEQPEQPQPEQPEQPQPPVDEQPQPPVDEQPQPPVDEQPQPPVDEQPQPPVDEQPQPPVDEQPQPPVDEQPQPPVDEQPQPPVDEQPQPPVDEQPQPPVDEQPQPPVDEQPQPPVDEQPQPPVDEQPQPPVDEQPQPPVDEQPQPPVDEQPQPPVDEQPQPPVDEQPQPPVDEQPQPPVDEQPQPPVDEQPQPPVDEQPQPPVDEQPQPPVDEQPQPPVDEQPQPPVDEQPQPPVDEQPQPPVDEQPQPPVDEQPQPPVDEQPQPPVDEQPQPEPPVTPPVDLPPTNPTLTPKDDGSVDLTPPSGNTIQDGDKFTLKVTPPTGGDPVAVVFTKTPNGWTSDNPDVVGNIEGNNKITIPADKIKDGTPVTAKSHDNGNSLTDGRPEESVTAGDPAPTNPTLVAKPDGSVDLTPPSDNTVEIGDKFTLKVTPPTGGEPVAVVFTKTPNGWTSDNPDVVGNIEGNNKITIPADKIKDGTPVTAKSHDNGNSLTDGRPEESVTAGDPAPTNPTLVANPDGSVDLTPPSDNTVEIGDKFTLKVTPPTGGDPVAVVFTKTPNGWTSDNPDVVGNIEGNNKITIPADKIKDGTPVTAKSHDNGNSLTDERPHVSVDAHDPAPANPSLSTDPEGRGIVVTPPADDQSEPGDKFTVKVTPPTGGDPVEVVFTKTPEGGWTSSDEGTIPSIPVGGTTTIPADKIKDGTPVTAKSHDNGHPITDERPYVSVDANDPPPANPTLTPKDDGSVDLTPPSGNTIQDGDKFTLKVTPPTGGNPVAVVFTKTPNGWTSDNPDVVGDITGDKINIPADKIKDGTPVTAKSHDNGNSLTDGRPEESVTAGDPAPTNPTLVAKPDGSVDLTPPSDNTVEIGDKFTLKVTPPTGGEPVAVVFTKTPNGWTSDNPDVVGNIEGNNKITIPADKIKDGTPVTAKSHDNGNSLTDGRPEESVTAGDPAPTNPTLVANPDGSVDLTPPSDNTVEIGDKFTLKVTPPTGGDPVAVVFTKTPNGWTSDNPDVVGNIEGNNKITIPADKIKDGTPVTAKSHDNGNSLTDERPHVSVDAHDPAPANPSLSTDPEGRGIVVTPPADDQSEPGDKFTVKVTPPTGGDPVEVVFTKTPEGGWTSSDEGTIPSIPVGGTTTIPTDKIKDGIPVTAKSHDNGHPITDERPYVSVDANDPPPANPTLTPKDDGSVDLTPPSGNTIQDGDKFTLKVTPPTGGNPVAVVFTKTPNGWTSDNPNVVGDITGDKINIPADKIKDGTPVTAKSHDNGNSLTDGRPEESVTAGDPAPTNPTLVANPDGSVDLTPPSDNTVEIGDKFTLKVTPPTGGEPVAVVFTKTPNGWTSDNPDVVGNIEGNNKITIPADKIKDGTPVTAKSHDNGNSLTDGRPEESVTAGDPAPTNPTLVANPDGSVDLTPPSDNTVEIGDKFTLKVTPPTGGDPVAVVFTKTPNGWTSDNPDVVGNIEGNNKITIPADKIKDGTPVTAKSHDNGNSLTDERPHVSVDAHDPAPANPSLSTDPEGRGIVVTPPADDQSEPGDKFTVKVTPPTGGDPVEVVFTKTPEGGWTSSDEGTIPSIPVGGTTTIPTDKIKDGIPVTAKSHDNGHPITDERPYVSVDANDPPPANPTLTPKDDGSVDLTPPSGNTIQDGDKFTLKVTPPTGGNPVAVVFTKTPNGWTSDNPNVVGDITGDKINIPADKIKDGTPVTAKSHDNGNSLTDGRPEESVTAGDPAPTNPTLVANPDGSVDLTPPSDNTVEIGDKFTLKVTPPTGGEPVAVVFTKTPNGWTSDNPDVVGNIEGNNKITIPADKIKDGTPVTAKSHDNGNSLTDGRPEESVTAGDPAPTNPTLVANPDGSVDLTPPSDNTVEIGDKFTLKVTPPTGGDPVAVVFTKTPNGWTSDNPDVVGNIEGNNKITIPADKIKDGTPVTAKSHDNGNSLTDERPHVSVDAHDPAPANPSLSTDPEGRGIVVTPPADDQSEPGDKFTVKVTPPTGGDPVEVVFTKTPEGGWTSSDEGTIPSIPVGGTTTIPADKIKDGTPVTAKSHDNGHPITDERPYVSVDANDPPPANPTLTPKDDGSVDLTPPSGNTIQDGDKFTLKVTPPTGGNPVAVVFTKTPNGWTSDNPDVVGDITGDKINIPADKIKDGTPVTAKSHDNGNSLTDGRPEESVTAGDPAPTNPTLVANPDGSVDLTPPSDNTVEIGDKFTLKVTPPTGGEPVAVVFTKTPNGWTSDNPDVVGNIEGNNKITIPADKIKDGSFVEAKSHDKGNLVTDNRVPAKVKAGDPAPANPTLTAKTDGSVDLTPPSDNTVEIGDKFTLKVVPPTSPVNGKPVEVVFEKTATGWTSSNPKVVGNITGNNKITIPADKIKDGSFVEAKSHDKGNLVTDNRVPAKVKAGDPAPANPTLTAKTDGSVDLIVPAANDKTVEVGDKFTLKYNSPTNAPVTLVFTKQSNGSWKSSNSKVIGDITGDKINISANKIKDRSTVTVQSHDDGNPLSETRKSTATAGDPAPTNPTLVAHTDKKKATYGSVDLTPPNDDTVEIGDRFTLKVTPPTGGNPVSVVFEKTATGWTSSNPNVIGHITGNNKVTISADKIKDGSFVEAKSHDEGNLVTDKRAPAKVKAGDPAPNNPTLTANDDGSIDLTAPATNDKTIEIGDKMTVKVTPPQGAQVTVVFTKTATGWTSSHPNVIGHIIAPPTGNNKVKIPADKIKDGIAVTAKSHDESNLYTDQRPLVSATKPAATPLNNVTVEKSIDTSTIADTNPEKFKISGVTDPGAMVTIRDKAKNELIQRAADNQGRFTFEVTEKAGTDMQAGDRFNVTAKATGKRISVEEQPVAPPVATDSASHTGDPNNPPPPVVRASTAKGDGSVTVTLPDQQAQVGDKVTISYTAEDNTAKTAVFTKTATGWTKTEGSLNVNGSTVTIPEDDVKDSSIVTAKTTDLAGRHSTTSEDRAGLDDLPLLTPRLAKDTAPKVHSKPGHSTDKVTNNPTIIVDGIPAGEAWEYNHSGTWVTGSGNSFNLPQNNIQTGKKHLIMVRIKGDQRTDEQLNTISVTYDHVAPRGSFGFNPMGDSKVGTGSTEPGALVMYTGHTIRRGVPKPHAYANAEGKYSINLGTDLKTASGMQFKFVDAAGNESPRDLTFRQPIIEKGVYGQGDGKGKTMIAISGGGIGNGGYVNKQLSNGEDILIIDSAQNNPSSGHNAPSDAWKDDIQGTAKLNFKGGDDYVFVKGLVQNPAQVDLGLGNDFMSIAGIGSGGGAGWIKGGDGNDTLEMRNPHRRQAGHGDQPVYARANGFKVELGNGDDTLLLSDNGKSLRNNIGSKFYGGEGYDSIVFKGTGNDIGRGLRNGGDNASSSKGIEGFERVDLGTNNYLYISTEFVKLNYGRQVADNGRVSYNALLVDGQGEVRIDASGRNRTASNTGTKVRVNGKEHYIYDVNHEGSHYQMWIDVSSRVILDGV